MNCISENQEIKNIWFNGIRVNDLEHIIKKIDEEGNILENLHKYGLPKNINKEALIALCCKNDNPRRTHFHEFKPLNKNFIKFNINNCKYDIPFYIHDVPDHFSLFESITEIIEVKKYYEKKKENNKNEEEENEINNLNNLPLPAENHNYCFLCKTKFEDYLIHIESEMHKKNFVKNKKNFNKIKDTLKRIGNFYDGKKNSNNFDFENKRERLYSNKKQKENYCNLNVINDNNNIKKLLDKKCKYNISQTNTTASSQNSQNIKSINIISNYLKNIKKKK